jgi:hypothetical protein
MIFLCVHQLTEAFAFLPYIRRSRQKKIVRFSTSSYRTVQLYVQFSPKTEKQKQIKAKSNQNQNPNQNQSTSIRTPQLKDYTQINKHKTYKHKSFIDHSLFTTVYK